MALDDARKALALRGAAYVHLLSNLENVRADHTSGLEASEILGGNPEFPEYVAGFDARLCEVTRRRLVDPAWPPPPKRDLHGAVSVGCLVLYLCDAIV